MGIKIAWGITGAGGFIDESIDVMKKVSKKYDLVVNVYLSRQSEIVLKAYKRIEDVKGHFNRVSIEEGPNTPFLAASLQLGEYSLFLITPASGNTVAKVAHGIADTLITNSASQAMKADIPVYIFPVDQEEGELITKLPGGRELKLRMRPVDVRNVEKLQMMQGITVLKSLEEIETIFQSFINNR